MNAIPYIGAASVGVFGLAVSFWALHRLKRARRTIAGLRDHCAKLTELAGRNGQQMRRRHERMGMGEGNPKFVRSAHAHPFMAAARAENVMAPKARSWPGADGGID